jgi:hypothetical protein
MLIDITTDVVTIGRERSRVGAQDTEDPDASAPVRSRVIVAGMPAYELWDARYGEVAVDLRVDERRVTVSGESIPIATLERAGTAGLDPDGLRKDVPIGTRHGRELRLTLDGDRYELHPGRGRFSRRSYRIGVTGRGHEWLFTPATPDSHRLVRGSRYRGDNEVAMFTTDESGITAEWSTEIRVAGVVAAAADPTPADCALGYALAAAFGTGARLMVVAIAAAASDAFFPG